MSNVIDLDDKIVLLTGASGGIGSVTAKLLLQGGARLVAHYGQDRAGAEAACSGVPADRVLLVQADLVVRGASRELWRHALAWHGRIDVVIVNAAVAVNLPFDSG